MKTIRRGGGVITSEVQEYPFFLRGERERFHKVFIPGVKAPIFWRYRHDPKNAKIMLGFSMLVGGDAGKAKRKFLTVAYTSLTLVNR